MNPSPAGAWERIPVGETVKKAGNLGAECAISKGTKPCKQLKKEQ
jgi:hypothetical protein